MGIAVKIMSVAMNLHNFCIDNDGGMVKWEKSTRKWVDANEELVKWLDWIRRGGFRFLDDQSSWTDVVFSAEG